MRYGLVVVLCIALLAPLMSHAQSDFSPIYEETDCAFLIPDGQRVECGYLTVPEDWADPTGRTIRLHVAIFRTANPQPQPDPIFYLEGGPGGSASSQMESSFNLLFEPFITNRDLVVLDQRGTGLSQPSLACPEADALTLELLPQALRSDEEIERELEALSACRKRLEGEGINLAAYTSAQNAADLAALRQARGYSQINLYGVSYGTRLALTLLRDHPEGIRSAVLDSSYPLQADLFATAAPHFERSLSLLFESCAADEGCNAAYPDLEGLTFGVAERLNAEPYLTEHIAPLSGETYRIALTGDRFMNFLFQALYQTGWLPYLPQMIAEAEGGQFDLLLTLYLGIVESLGSVSYGMNLSVQCAEEIPFGDPTTIQSASEGSPLQDFMDAQLNTGRYMYDACTLWTPQAAPDPQENQAVTSAIPTLIVAGEFDPITPPEWGAILHEDLTNSYFYTLPATGHGAALGNDCASQLLLNFWDSPNSDPAPTCLAGLPAIQFVAPDQAPDVTFEAWQSATYGVVGVQPAGWEAFTEGIWVRPGLYDTALIQLSLPNVGKEAAFGALLGQMGVTDDPTLLETRQANDYTWEVYQTAFQGQVVYIAAAEAGDTLLLVMLQARDSEAAGLYEVVLLPAIDALRQE